MLAKDECRAFRFLRDLIDKCALQCQSSLKVQLAKQVDAQQRPGG
jgi:hypothetical protein